MDQSVPTFAGVVVVTKEDQLVLQLRDDKPDIPDPGKLSIFAGRLHPGETPKDAAYRELLEETTLKRDDMQFLFRYEKDPERHGGPGVCYVYILNSIDPSQIEIHEGQGYRLARIKDLNEDNCALISYDILRKYADASEPLN